MSRVAVRCEWHEIPPGTFKANADGDMVVLGGTACPDCGTVVFPVSVWGEKKTERHSSERGDQSCWWRIKDRDFEDKNLDWTYELHD